MSLSAMLLGFWLAGQPTQAEPPLAAFRGFRWIESPQTAPDYVFVEGDGREWGFLEFRGQVVIATFWATWCGVCAREMPKLDRLQARLGGEGLAVVALSQDRGGPEVVQRYFEERGIRNLRVFHDTANVLGTTLGIRGVPTSFVIDGQGRMVGVAQGPADWESPEAIAIFDRYLSAAKREPGVGRENGAAIVDTAVPAPE